MKLDCSKKQYLTFQHASNDAQAIRRKHETDSIPYRCRTCNAWHVGSQGNMKYRARGERISREVGTE